MTKEEEELHTLLESMPNPTTEEAPPGDRDLFEEVVEVFVALQKSREDGSSSVLCSAFVVFLEFVI